MYNFFLPFLLGVITSFSLPPYNFLILNFLTFPALFLILVNNNKKKTILYGQVLKLVGLLELVILFPIYTG